MFDPKSVRASQLKMTGEEFLKLVLWMRDPNRKPANEAFSEGADRDAAYAFEQFWRETDDKTWHEMRPTQVRESE